MHIKVGSRGSRLALWQSAFVIGELKKRFPEHTFEMVAIQTKGDKILHKPLNQIGDKGLFVKEIEEQLYKGTIDFAVHSMKDMPSDLPPGLLLADPPKREDARDALVLRGEGDLSSLKEGARIGAGSGRRAVQLRALRPDLTIADIRGNLETRLKKLKDGEYDGLVMAAAGLIRLNLAGEIASYFSLEEMVPASAQGALALEVKEEREDIINLLKAAADQETAECISCERAFLKTLEGGCHVPAGAHCIKTEEGYRVYAVFGDVKKNRCVRLIKAGPAPVELGVLAAATLKKNLEEWHEG